MRPISTLLIVFQYLAETCALAMLIPFGALASGQLPSLVRLPREIKWSAGGPVIIAPDAVAIVLGRQASEPEQHAARMLQNFVAKRFGQQWPVVREGQEQAAHKTLVL